MILPKRRWLKLSSRSIRSIRLMDIVGRLLIFGTISTSLSVTTLPISASSATLTYSPRRTTRYILNPERYVTIPHLIFSTYNKQRPCFAIGYDTPMNYRKRHYKEELERKDTFSKRELSEIPKLVQKQKSSTSLYKLTFEKKSCSDTSKRKIYFLIVFRGKT